MAHTNLHHLATATTRLLQCKNCLDWVKARARVLCSCLPCGCFKRREVYWVYYYPQGNRHQEGH